jgi:hypothetical protein
MKIVERKIQARLRRARENGLAGIYVWSPTAAEIKAFDTASTQVEWSLEGERLRESSLEMLAESLSEAGTASYLKLVVGLNTAGAMVGFGLLDEDSAEHGFELITLATQEDCGFGSALLAAVAARAHDQEVFLNASEEAEGFYDAMGLAGGDGWRSLPATTGAVVGPMFDKTGIAIHECAPVWPTLAVGIE